MKKRLKAIVAAAMTAVTVLPMAACGGSTAWYKSYSSINDSEDYNKNLYYLNELKFEIADPSVIYVGTGEEKGYFYAYGTSDLVGCFGIQCWRSKDLTNWEYKSVAYQPDFDNTWGYSNHWAPEVIYDEDEQLYLMFFNADWNEKGSERKYITVAYSQNPYGPFVCFNSAKSKPAFDFTAENPNPEMKKKAAEGLARNEAIDAHPFVDPVSKKKYLYYSGYSHGHDQTIFGVEMKDWLTPDYSTLTELTHLFKTTVDGNEEINEGQGLDTVNEGPFMWYEDGTYYLTFSVYNWTRPQYNVRQAISTSPLGKFTKIQPADGGAMLITDPAWETNASVGHHCFIKCGDSLMMAYHTFKNRNDVSDGRALAVDSVSFVENSKGQKVMHCNGPTYSYQPLPEEISGYKNVAKLASVSVNSVDDDSDAAYLTDGTVAIHEGGLVNEFRSAGGDVKITLSFDKFVNARSIMIYNSASYDEAFWNIDNIELKYKKSGSKTGSVDIKNVAFDTEWGADTFSEFMNPGTSSIVEFAELPVNEIVITIKAGKDQVIAINEIVVLGKEVENPAAASTLDGTYSFTNPAPVNPLPVYESNTFGKAGKYESTYGYDLTHDDGTENAYVDKVWCGNSQLLFFKDIESNSVYVEASVSVLDHTRNYMGDRYPKIGLVLKSIDNYFAFFNIDCLEGFNGQNVGWVESNAAGTDYLWSNYGEQSKSVSGGIKYTGSDFTKLAFARIDNHCWMFVNDKLVFDLPNGTLMGFTNNERTACSPAFLTYNTFARFAKYSATGERSEVQSKLTELGVKF